MSNRTPAIVFRNPHLQRSTIRTQLCLFRHDGSSAHIECMNQGDFQRTEKFIAPGAPRGIR
jgi:hypothetical protein